MNPDWTQWQDYLAQQGLAASHLDFGQPLAELQSAQSGSIIAPLTDLGLIRATGADADTFLHNLLTNDVEGLPANGAHRSGLCTPKGRLLASFLLWRDTAAGEAESSLLLAMAADLHAGILKKLSMYVLRAKVKLSDASQTQVVLGLSGPQAGAALRSLDGLSDLPTANLHSSHFSQGRVLRLNAERYLLITDTASAAALWQQLTQAESNSLRPVGLDAWRWLDVAAGIPQISAATREEFTPQMVNFELIGGVNFKKGCYPGQEIVARTQYLGKVKRRMYRLHAANAAERPDPGMPIFAAAGSEDASAPQACGMVVNVAASPQGGYDLLAVLQTAQAETGKLHLHTGDGPLLVSAPLPYALD